jgi:V8-like Glu-specific endopeptidase
MTIAARAPSLISLAALAAACASAAGAVLAPGAARADEGMWTFDAFPADRMRAAHGWAPDRAWLDRVQASAVRLSSGCSASFVSPTGLVLTNWHCVSDCVAELSSAASDYGTTGFITRAQSEEKACPGVEGEVLESIVDVTEQVRAAIASVPASELARRTAQITAAIEAEACEGKDTAKYRCSVVPLFRGGQYKLYTYRLYKEMRLVFAPENAVGFFGGDPDNFNFPRFNLDAAFLRAYEDGRPVSPASFLRWRTDAVREGDIVLVAGNPGSTQRLLTTDQLRFLRDWSLPVRQLVRSELRGRVIQYQSQGADQLRESTDQLFGIENSYKAQYGQMRALMDPVFLNIKQREEAALRAAVRASPELAGEIGDPWAEISAAVTTQRALFLEHDFLEARAGSISQLYQMARQIVRAADEAAKPAGDRLPGYSDAGIERIHEGVLVARQIFPDQERMGLELWLSKTREYVGVDNAAVRRLLGRESPEGLARRLIGGTQLGDPAVRQALISGGKAAVDASSDPLIQFVRATDADARAIAARWRSQVQGPVAAASERIAKARFRIQGDSTYPDATFTLRLSYGTVRGWNANGQTVGWSTTIGGKYDRATGAAPFALSPAWVAAASRVDRSVVFNIVSDNDIIGGNSGSPLIDREGRVVGAVFDGNIHSLGGDFAFDGRVNRTVTVTTAAVTEALRSVYQLDGLLTELGVTPAR